MNVALMPVYFLAGLFVSHWAYWRFIVPSHYRYAEKRGIEYDPRQNRFIRRNGPLARVNAVGARIRAGEFNNKSLEEVQRALSEAMK